MRKFLLFIFITQISKVFFYAAVKKIQNAVKVALKRNMNEETCYKFMTKKAA
jgi:hypothetical protein